MELGSVIPIPSLGRLEGIGTRVTDIDILGIVLSIPSLVLGFDKHRTSELSWGRNCDTYVHAPLTRWDATVSDDAKHSALVASSADAVRQFIQLFSYAGGGFIGEKTLGRSNC